MRINKFIGILIFSLLTFLGSNRIYAADKINLYLFWTEGCPRCKEEKIFLQKLIDSNEDLHLHTFEVSKNKDNQKKLQQVIEKLNTDFKGFPFLVIGDKSIYGFLGEDSTGKEIENIIEEYRKNGCIDLLNMHSDEVDCPGEINISDAEISEIYNVESGQDSCETEDSGGTGICAPNEDLKGPTLPKFANFDLEQLSLPALTVVLGFLDGFNPCAMWVLLFLISLLLDMKDRKKMWILGLAFIISSALVYFLFMFAWLNFFLFVGYIYWSRVLIAGIAFVGGYKSLKKFLNKGTPGCDVEGDEKRRSIFEKLGKITSNKSFLLALVGIIALSFAVNLVELVCSAGLPAVYTQVLVLSNLSKIVYDFYLLLYILFFMFDDLFVFFVAMKTLQMTGITTKYVKWSRLIGGILMVAIGVLLLFRPEILMFG